MVFDRFNSCVRYPYFFYNNSSYSLPFDQVIAFMFHDTQGNTLRLNKLFRLVRFPRLYRLFKILRLFKMLKLFSTSPIFNKILKKVNLNIGFMRMLKFIVNIFFLNHFVGCLWFFIVKPFIISL